MPFCVNCRYEYVPGTTRCPDCGADLVDALPEPITEPLVTIWEAPDQITAVSVKAALEEAGIPAVEQVQRAWAYNGIDLSLRGVYSSFLVPESRADEARAVIEEHLRAMQAGELTLEDDAAEGTHD